MTIPTPHASMVSAELGMVSQTQACILNINQSEKAPNMLVFFLLTYAVVYNIEQSRQFFKD